MENTIVLDIGCGFCKIGFAGDSNPSYIFPSIIGRPSNSATNLFANMNDIPVGENCNAAIHTITYPIQHGIVADWDGLEYIIDYAFNKLLGTSDLSNHPIIITDSVYGDRRYRHFMADILFRRFHVSHFYVNYQPFFSILSRPGRCNGIVLEIGDGITQIFPCIGGYPIKTGMNKYPIGGRDISEYLMKKFDSSDLHGKNHLKDFSIIKEKYCRVALDYQNERSLIEPISFTYNDHQFTIGTEQIDAPEILFHPNEVSGFEYGIHILLYNAIRECNPSIQKNLYEKVIISGGIAGMKGLDKRLEKELKLLAPDEVINVYALPNSSESSWKGASKFAKHKNYFLNNFAVSKNEFTERKYDVVDEKCFSFQSN